MAQPKKIKTSGLVAAEPGRRQNISAERGLPDPDGGEKHLLSPDAAAVIAGRSVRTIRRAYRAGRLRAFRDGNGHGVRIRYGDLRQWMMATSAAAPVPEPQGPGEPPAPRQRLDMGGTTPVSGSSENLALLNASRARMRRVDGPGGGASRRSEGPAGAPRA
jgi:excisionase family DNA binding protein